jgi:hypothetical protein
VLKEKMKPTKKMSEHVPTAPKPSIYEDKRRYVLSRQDPENGFNMPLSRQEIIHFIKDHRQFSEYFNDDSKCSGIKLNQHTEGRPIYDHWEKAAKKIIKEIWKIREAWIFFEPVDSIKLNIPDYHNIIKRPMDLGTIKNNLNAGNFENPEEFVRDLMLIFDNCILYNGEGSPVSVMCKNVRAECERLVADNQLAFYFKD